MSADAVRTEQRFPLTLLGVREARHWVRGVLAAMHVDRADLDRVAVAVSELAVNLIEHARAEDSEFSLSIRDVANSAAVDLRAMSRSFASLDEFRAAARAPEDLDPLAEGGRGVYIVLHYFPDVQYAPSPSAAEPEVYTLRVPRLQPA